MEILLIVILFAAIFIIMMILLLKLPKAQILNQQLLDLKNQLNDIKTKQLESSNLSLEQQSNFYQKSQTMLSDVHQKLGKIEEASKNLQDFGKDIIQLQDLLKAPKLRGNLGEYLLEDLLKQVLPEKNFETQFKFNDGSLVDAVIRLGDGLVPIDSKFPLESFQRMIKANNDLEKNSEKKEFIKSVKKRIDEISMKYIKESEGTYNFAMMYIPAENIFYEIIITDNLSDKKYEIFNYALNKRVVPVSPNSFYSYLMAIAFGLKGFKIEQQAKTIMSELSKVQASYSTFFSDFTMIGRHLKNANTKYDDTYKRAEKFNDKISEITGIKKELIESNNDD